jgi:hypothetical protein
MNKKGSFSNSETINEMQRQLHNLLKQHYKLNSEVDSLNVRIYSLSSHESDHLRHVKLRKLKLKDRIESLRAKLQLAE